MEIKEREEECLFKLSVWELKLEKRDDYSNSQLSSRLSSLFQTSSIYLPHVKHEQHFFRTTQCGRFAAQILLK